MARLKQYIVLLWPSSEDGELVEGFRKRIGGSPEALLWPPHISLFYGIAVEDKEPLLLALRRLARETRAFPLRLDGIGTFGTVVYLKIKFCEEIAVLQARIREIVAETCDIQCDYDNYTKPDGSRLTVEEVKNMQQWGSFYPFLPHITLAQHLLPEQVEEIHRVAERSSVELPEQLTAAYMSLAIYEAGSTVSETIEAMSFAEAEP